MINKKINQKLRERVGAFVELQKAEHYRQADATQRSVWNITWWVRATFAAVVIFGLGNGYGAWHEASRLTEENAALERKLEETTELANAMEEVNIVLTERLLETGELIGPTP